MHFEQVLMMFCGGLLFIILCSVIGFLLNKFYIARPVHTYKGHILSSDKIAILRTDDEVKHKIAFGLNSRLMITRIDGKLIPQFLSIFLPFPSRYVHLLPGKHIVNLLFLKHGFSSHCQLWLLAEKDRAYTAKAEMIGVRVRFWIVDAATGKETGGIKGSSDEPI